MSIVKITFHGENIYDADSQDDKPILSKKPKMCINLIFNKKNSKIFSIIFQVSIEIREVNKGKRKRDENC